MPWASGKRLQTRPASSSSLETTSLWLPLKVVVMVPHLPSFRPRKGVQRRVVTGSAHVGGWVGMPPVYTLERLALEPGHTQSVPKTILILSGKHGLVSAGSRAGFPY